VTVSGFSPIYIEKKVSQANQEVSYLPAYSEFPSRLIPLATSRQVVQTVTRI
jgi:hypothetical protein